MAAKEKTVERGYGPRHKERRKRWAPLVAAGECVCARCGELIVPGTFWDLGHDDHDRTLPTHPEHRSCNRSAAAAKGNNCGQSRPLRTQGEPGVTAGFPPMGVRGLVIGAVGRTSSTGSRCRATGSSEELDEGRGFNPEADEEMRLGWASASAPTQVAVCLTESRRAGLRDPGGFGRFRSRRERRHCALRRLV